MMLNNIKHIKYNIKAIISVVSENKAPRHNHTDHLLPASMQQHANNHTPISISYARTSYKM